MTGPDASHGEMPGFPLPSRPGPELGEPVLDALLGGQSLSADAPEQAALVARMLADLAAPAEPGELAGETAARLAFARCPSPAGISPATRRSARRRPLRLPVPRAGLAAALVVAAAGLGGAAAAYAGVLPGPVQDVAHHMIGAPPAHRADPHQQQPGSPSGGQLLHGRAGQEKAHATPGDGKGRRKPLPSPAKGHAKPPTPPGKVTHPKPPRPKGQATPPKPRKPNVSPPSARGGPSRKGRSAAS